MRSSGILLHITSLPSPYGIGTMGQSAYDFIDFLKKSGQSYWQVLPLGPTSYGDSPYQTFSVFAGNPYLIDLDILVKWNLLKKEDLILLENDKFIINLNRVNYANLYQTRFLILKKVYYNYLTNQNSIFDINKTNFDRFIENNDFWLDDYALFMTLKSFTPGKDWRSWDKCYQTRDLNSLNNFKDLNKEEINFQKFIQFLFYVQWDKLKKYANLNNVKIIGDMPIYVAYDSSDVWANPEFWQLDEFYNPRVVAGVPPDYFSINGQLWGNPIYDYEKMKKDDYFWWIKRIKKAFELFDVVRIDHFRGFEAYYAIPFKDKNAKRGKWVKGPGIGLFNKIKEELGDMPIIAEDLGLITPEVHELLEETGYPGMKVLQFAFTPGEDSLYLPHNYTNNSVCYTGTHDNMTLKQWVDTIDEKEKDYCFEYLGIDNNENEEAVDKLICLALSSVSKLVIIPLVDYLHLGKEARFNTPSSVGGNWTWRLDKSLLTDDLSEKILKFSKIYKRTIQTKDKL